MSTTLPADRLQATALTPPGLRVVVWTLLVVLVLVLPWAHRAPEHDHPADGRPFADGSPFNLPVPPGSPVDPQSEAMLSQVTRSGDVAANLYEYGVPVYQAQPGDPRYSVSCSRAAEWGSCPLSKGERWIPAEAEPSPGTDGAMVVVQDDGTVDEYWQARRTGTTWTAAWGAINAWDGPGWGGASTGSGASRLAGVVRVAEIRNGSIDHALAMQSDNVCAGVFRPPALKTDGESHRADCLPEGARVQLDPGIDLSTVPNLTPGERTVARALQVYGGYIMDRSGTGLSVSFETARDASPVTPGSVYSQAGLGWDYSGMDHVPWNRLRVLARWDG